MFRKYSSFGALSVCGRIAGFCKSKQKRKVKKVRGKSKKSKKSGKRKRCIYGLLLAFAIGAVLRTPIAAKAAEYEAKIGDAYYESLEEAFEHAKAGDTISVLKNCSVSKTLVITEENITLRSEDVDNPAVISREDVFAGKLYAESAGNVLMGVESGNLSMQDIILDGGAILDEAFHNSGKVWDSPLLYVKGACSLNAGAVLQNNYNTDGSSDGLVRTAGALQAAQGHLVINGGEIRDCYTNGAGGGIQLENGSTIETVSGIVRHCCGTWGGGIGLLEAAELTGMTFSQNSASSSGGAVWSMSPLTVQGCKFEENQASYSGGALSASSFFPLKVESSSFLNNCSRRGSAVDVSGEEGTEQSLFKDCTFTGNRTAGTEASAPLNGSAISYMHKAGMMLEGNIIMENNLDGTGKPCDIVFWYADAKPIVLGSNFASDSVIVLGGYEMRPVMLLVDAVSGGKEAEEKQFPWNTETYQTKKIDGNIYLAEGEQDPGSGEKPGSGAEENLGSGSEEKPDSGAGEGFKTGENENMNEGNEQKGNNQIDHSKGMEGAKRAELSLEEDFVKTGHLSPIRLFLLLGACGLFLILCATGSMRQGFALLRRIRFPLFTILLAQRNKQKHEK